MTDREILLLVFGLWMLSNVAFLIILFVLQNNAISSLQDEIKRLRKGGA